MKAKWRRVTENLSRACLIDFFSWKQMEFWSFRIRRTLSSKIIMECLVLLVPEKSALYNLPMRG